MKTSKDTMVSILTMLGATKDLMKEVDHRETVCAIATVFDFEVRTNSETEEIILKPGS